MRKKGNIETEYADVYKTNNINNKGSTRDVFPFPDNKGNMNETVCDHAQSLTGVTEGYEAGTIFGIVAMKRGDGGLFVRYNADQLRELGSQLLAMATHLDEENE